MRIAVVNHTNVPTVDVKHWCAAINVQVRDHVAPVWSRKPIHVALTATPLATDFEVHIFDDADQQGALGYHDINPQGHPYGRVFRKVSEDNGVSVSSVLSHEIVEIFGDPWVSWLAECPSQNRIYALELCDAVEDQTYAIRDVEVSDFVTPRYFVDLPGSTENFDWLGVLTKPFSMTKGGYSIVMSEGNWSNIVGDHYPDWRRSTKWNPAARTVWRQRAQFSR